MIIKFIIFCYKSQLCVIIIIPRDSGTNTSLFFSEILIFLYIHLKWIAILNIFNLYFISLINESIFLRLSFILYLIFTSLYSKICMHACMHIFEYSIFKSQYFSILSIFKVLEMVTVTCTGFSFRLERKNKSFEFDLKNFTGNFLMRWSFIFIHRTIYFYSSNSTSLKEVSTKNGKHSSSLEFLNLNRMFVLWKLSFSLRNL